MNYSAYVPHEITYASKLSYTDGLQLVFKVSRVKSSQVDFLPSRLKSSQVEFGAKSTYFDHFRV